MSIKLFSKSVEKPEVNLAASWHEPINFAECDQIQVQFAGAIMPHGVLLILNNEYQLMGCSENASDKLGQDISYLLDRKPDRLLGSEGWDKIEQGLQKIADNRPPNYFGCLAVLPTGHWFDVLGHRSGHYYILEFEPIANVINTASTTERFSQINEMVGALQNVETWLEGMRLAVEGLKELSGYDSVIGVRFLPDGSRMLLPKPASRILNPIWISVFLALIFLNQGVGKWF